MALSVHTPSRDAWPLSRMRYLPSTYKALFDQPSQGDTKLLHGKQRFFRGLLMPVSQKLHDPVDNGIGFQCEPHTAVEPGGFRIEGTAQANVENDFRAPSGLSCSTRKSGVEG